MKLKQPFILGKTFLRDMCGFFFISLVENDTHIYEYISHNKTKKITKSSNEVIEIDDLIKFRQLKMNKQLFGFDEIESKLVKYLNTGRDRVICLHGPKGCGKRIFLKKLEDLTPNKHFFTFNFAKFQLKKGYLDDLKKNIENLGRRMSIVLCIPNIDIISHENVNAPALSRMLIDLVEQSINLVIVMTATDLNFINSKLRSIVGKKILVINHLEKVERFNFVKHLLNIAGKDKSEEDITTLTHYFRGFSPAEIEKFVRDVLIEFPDFDLDQVEKCSKDPKYISRRLSQIVANVDALRWSDIGGYEDVKKELIDRIQRPLLSGKGILKGVLMHGPPGCSKTMFARALATECQLPLFMIKPSNIMRSLVGQSEASLRRILMDARASAPSIVFVDEIDTIFPRRGQTSETSVSVQLLNELMTFMDGVATKRNEQVILVGATNRLDRLDEALIRPGRIDLHIEVGLPNQNARESIIQIAFNNSPFPVDRQIIDDLPNIARSLANLSGAEIVQVVKEISDLAEQPIDPASDPIITMHHVSQILTNLNEYI